MNERGSSLVGVLAVLTLLAMVMAVMVRLMVTDLSETRRRSNTQYATELAHSGIDWAVGCIVSRCGLSDTTLQVEGGKIAITVDVGDGGTKIRSRGSVVASGAVLETREEVMEIGTRTQTLESPPAAPVVSPSFVTPEEPPEIGRPVPLSPPN